MKLGHCMTGHHALCEGTIKHSYGVRKITECACDGKGHTQPHLKEDPDGEGVVKRK